MKVLVIPEQAIRAMAAAEPDGAAAKCLAEAEEMKARGKLYRFIFDGRCLGVQESRERTNATDSRKTE